MSVKDNYIDDNGVLINNLGITDNKTLKQAEMDICIPKIITAGKNFSKRFDSEYIKALHKHIFGDIYPWAGEFRTVPVYKTEKVIPGLSLEYTAPRKIEQELNDKLEALDNVPWDKLSLDDKAAKFSRMLALLWRVHPFRDGNTRTMMTFAYLFSRSKGFPLDLSYLMPHLVRQYDKKGKVLRYNIRDKLVLAALDDKDNPEPEHLSAVIKAAIKSGAVKQQADYDSYERM